MEIKEYPFDKGAVTLNYAEIPAPSPAHLLLYDTLASIGVNSV